MTCIQCNTEKSLENFAKRRGKHRNRCKECCKLNRGKEVILQVTKEFEEEIRFKTIIC